MEIRKTTISSSAAIVLVLICLGFFMRLLPHMPNFTPVGAIALFGGAVLAWRTALLLPLVIMISSDLVIGFYQGIEYTWAAFFIVVLFGMLFRKAALGKRVILGGLGGATLFFIISNSGTWIAGGMYPHTITGLQECFVAALPFFRTTLLADVVFSFVLFGVYELAYRQAMVFQQNHVGVKQ